MADVGDAVARGTAMLTGQAIAHKVANHEFKNGVTYDPTLFSSNSFVTLQVIRVPELRDVPTNSGSIWHFIETFFVTPDGWHVQMTYNNLKSLKMLEQLLPLNSVIRMQIGMHAHILKMPLVPLMNPRVDIRMKLLATNALLPVSSSERQALIEEHGSLDTWETRNPNAPELEADALARFAAVMPNGED
jgi:hypothetical protein